MSESSTPSHETNWVFLGLEIEVAWSSYFPERYQKWFLHNRQPRTYREFSVAEQVTFGELCTTLDARMRPLLQGLTHTHNLTIGKDAYHEFVLPPIQNPEQICAILADLTKNGGLPKPLYQPHSLHITLGALEEVEDLGIFIIALEILAGVTPARIQSWVHSQNSKYSAGWARRGSAGYKVRPKNELSCGATTGIEIRTLVLPLNPIEQQTLIFFTSVFGTHLLNSEAESARTRDRWLSIKAQILWVLQKYGLLDRKTWRNPSENPESWIKYKALLRDESEFLKTFLYKSLAETSILHKNI